MRACLERIHHGVENGVSAGISKLSRKCAEYPYLTVLLSLAMTVACGMGFAHIHVETEGVKLWVPFDSVAYKNWEKDKRLFSGGRFEDYLILNANEGENVLTKAAFDSLWELHDCIERLPNYKGLCFRFSPEADCVKSNPLKYWNYNETLYHSTVANDHDILKALKTKQFASGEYTNERFMFGSKRKYGDDGWLAFSPVMSGLLFIKEEKEPAMQFELDFLSCFGVSGAPLNPKQTQPYKGIHVFGQALRSLDDELLRIVSLDVPLMMLTYVIMIFFVCFALSRGLPCTKKANFVLASGGVGAVMLSTIAGYGICMACGIPFTSLQQVLPFILVAIGVDDMFIFVAQFRRLEQTTGSVADRIEIAVHRCAMSITYTTLTDFVSFLAGSMSSLPAIEYFCKYAAVAVLFDFTYQITMFVAILALETRREQRDLPDCCCCAEACKPSEMKTSTEGPKVNTFVEQNSFSPERKTKLGKFLENVYAPILAKRPVQIVIIIIFLGVTAVNVYFAVEKVEEGFDIVDITPDESYMRDYLNLQTEYGLSVFDEYLPTFVYMDNVRYWEIQEQKKVKQTLDKAGKSDKMEVTPTNWMAELAKFSHDVFGPPNTTMPEFLEIPEAAWYQGLEAFVEHHPAGKVYKGDLAQNENGQIISSKVQFFHPLPNPSAAAKIEAMDAMYEAIEESELGDRAWGFTFAYIFITQFKIIYKELLVNFSCCLVAVAIMSLVFIGDWKAIVMFCLIIVMIDIDLIGGMHLWGVYLSSITLINLVMAVGLVVDYLAHLAHFFLLQDPSLPPEKRLCRAMGEIGPSVILGGFTTFLGIMPLIGGSSYIFRVFFMMFFNIIGYAMLHALLLLPVLLILVNPKPPGFNKVVPIEDA